MPTRAVEKGKAEMWPYWLLFVSIAALVLMRLRLPDGQSKWAWRFATIAVAVMMGFRHEVGGDWFTYELQFAASYDEALWIMVANAKDPGYALASWLVAQVGGGVHLLNFLCALPLAAGTVALGRRQPWPMLALLAAVPYLLIVVGMGYTRQAAAIGFSMFGLVALGDKRQITFVAWVLIAAAFHKSAVLLLPIAALSATRNRIWTSVWIAAATAIGAWLFLVDAAEVLVSNYVVSDYASASEGAAIRVAMNAVPAILVWIYQSRLFPDLAERKLWVSMASLALLMAALLPVSATAVDRISLYLIPLQLVVFSRLPALVSEVRRRTIVVVAIVGYYAVVEFVWLNFASHASAWLPYQFIPLW